MDPRQHYCVRVDLFCLQNISSLWELHALLRTWKSSLSLAFRVLFAKPMACIYIFLFHALLSVGLYWCEASFLADWISIAVISLHAHAFDMLGDCCRNPGAVYLCTCGLTACNAYLVTKRVRLLVRPTYVHMLSGKQNSRQCQNYSGCTQMPAEHRLLFVCKNMTAEYRLLAPSKYTTAEHGVFFYCKNQWQQNTVYYYFTEQICKPFSSTSIL